MKKLLALSLFIVSSHSLHAESAIAHAVRNNPTLRAVVGLGGLCLMFGVGEATRHADNNQNANRNKWFLNNNNEVSDLTKSLTAGAMLTWYEILMGNGNDADLIENLIKVGLVTATNYTANTELAGDVVRQIPGIGVLLSDGKDQGQERFGFGRLSRCVATYMAYRGAAQYAGWIK